MRRMIFCVLFVSLWVFENPSSSWAEDFLGIPIVPQAQIVGKTDSRLEILSPLSHDEIIQFYKRAFEKEKDIRVRDWTAATYMEDNSNRPWHSITISKVPENGMIRAIFAKDSMGWLIGTLMIRYAAVFVVLAFLFLSMKLAGAIISRTVKKTA
ncbi:MAG: hypothetical protein JW836_02035 [Deltaproteobacteria bacterium]|nr:hypothetical protein [Deltaproteobacteria bacterium]